MPQLPLGRVRGADLTRAVYAEDDEDIADISTTTFTAGAPELGVFFRAPITGKVLVWIALFGNTDATTNRLIMSTEMYVDNKQGTLLGAVNAEDLQGVILATNGTASVTGVHCRFVSGLVARGTYYVRTVHRVTGGAVADIAHRQLLVVPVP